MRTVGELLKLARLKKKWTLSDAEKETRIRKKYLEALEENAFDLLPGVTYTTGFLKNYSRVLDLNPEQMLSLYRRSYDEKRSQKVIPEGLIHPVNRSLINLTPRILAVSVAVGVLMLFLGYLLFEYRFAVGHPALVVFSPVNNLVTHDETVIIRGRTDPDTVVTINSEQITVQVDGSFSQTVSLPNGVNRYTITATNRLGKETNKVIAVERE